MDDGDDDGNAEQAGDGGNGRPTYGDLDGEGTDIEDEDVKDEVSGEGRSPQNGQES